MEVLFESYMDCLVTVLFGMVKRVVPARSGTYKFYLRVGKIPATELSLREGEIPTTEFGSMSLPSGRCPDCGAMLSG